MPISATRHFEASFATIEWLLEDRKDELNDEEIAACKVFHELLVETSQDLWDAQPPHLTQKTRYGEHD